MSPREHCFWSTLVFIFTLGFVRITGRVRNPVTGERWYFAPFKVIQD